jgi:hypothetical protein
MCLSLRPEGVSAWDQKNSLLIDAWIEQFPGRARNQQHHSARVQTERISKGFNVRLYVGVRMYKDV